MSDNESNIIPFPKLYDLPDNQESVYPAIINARESYADLLSAEIAGDAFAKCIIGGYVSISDEKNAKDCILVVEALKSLLLKSININYPLQDFADKAMTVYDIGFDDDEFLD